MKNALARMCFASAMMVIAPSSAFAQESDAFKPGTGGTAGEQGGLALGGPMTFGKRGQFHSSKPPPGKCSTTYYSKSEVECFKFGAGFKDRTQSGHDTVFIVKNDCPFPIRYRHEARDKVNVAGESSAVTYQSHDFYPGDVKTISVSNSHERLRQDKEGVAKCNAQARPKAPTITDGSWIGVACAGYLGNRCNRWRVSFKSNGICTMRSLDKPGAIETCVWSQNGADISFSARSGGVFKMRYENGVMFGINSGHMGSPVQWKLTRDSP